MNGDCSADHTTWAEVLSRITGGGDLTGEQAYWAMGRIMEGSASDLHIGAFLVALRTKGETATELEALSRVVREHAITLPVRGDALDIVGTGGDQLDTVNISTMAAILCAAAGAQVVKHGNRASSSTTGSADVLAHLGVNIDQPLPIVWEALERLGLTFCFAPAFHPSFLHAAPARKHLGIPTAFNVLGPLCNPGRVSHYAIGVSDRTMAPRIAGVLSMRGDRGVVFRGAEGLDELSPCGPSQLWWVAGGTVTEIFFDPRDVGVELISLVDLRGGSTAHNAAVVSEVLQGRGAPAATAVLLNAALALSAYHDVAPDAVLEGVRERLEQVREVLQSGKAYRLLCEWAHLTEATAGV